MTDNKKLRVTDSSCTPEYTERVHTVKVRGEFIDVKFQYGVETILPFEQGIKFMKDGFKVEEVDGTVLMLPAVAKEEIVAALPKDEAVANLAELKLSALILRAGQKPGGELYFGAGEESRADIIAFLIGEPPAAVGGDAETVVDAGEESLIDEGDDAPETVIIHPVDEPVETVAADEVATLEDAGFDPAAPEGDESVETEVKVTE